jgi:hypothetical protein
MLEGDSKSLILSWLLCWKSLREWLTKSETAKNGRRASENQPRNPAEKRAHPTMAAENRRSRNFARSTDFFAGASATSTTPTIAKTTTPASSRRSITFRYSCTAITPACARFAHPANAIRLRLPAGSRTASSKKFRVRRRCSLSNSSRTTVAAAA